MGFGSLGFRSAFCYSVGCSAFATFSHRTNPYTQYYLTFPFGLMGSLECSLSVESVFICSVIVPAPLTGRSFPLMGVTREESHLSPG